MAPKRVRWKPIPELNVERCSNRQNTVQIPADIISIRARVLRETVIDGYGDILKVQAQQIDDPAKHYAP